MLGLGVFVAIAGTLGGAFGAAMLSPEVRGSMIAFVAFLAAGFLLLRGVGPVTRRVLGPGVGFFVGMAMFWTFLLGVLVAIAGRVDSALLAYGLSIGAGFFIGMMYGAFNPDFVRSEAAWMGVAFPLAPTGATIATAVLRGPLAGSGAVLDMAACGALAGAVLMVPMGILMVRLRDEAQGLYRMGLLFLHNDNFAPKAVAYFDRAIALRGDDAQLWNLRGIAWSRMDESAKARADWAKAMQLSPKDPDPHLNRGTDAMRHGDIDHAIECFRKAIELAPGAATAHSNLGGALERRGDLAEAIAAYDRAIRIDPEYVNAYSNRGFARFRMGDHHAAVADCERAIELAPTFANAYVNRGHALAALGARAEAEASFRTAIEFDPDPRIVEEAMRALEQLAGDGGESDA
jgi:tetratricopeptide (TPR) repeat protein